MKKTIIILSLIFLLPTLIWADINSNNILDNIISQYRNSAELWAPVIKKYAITLFWILAGIEMSWTGITMAINGSGMQEFTAELVKRVMIIGFFFALLSNSSEWAKAIIDSLRKIAGDATIASGGLSGISPSAIFDMGLQLAGQMTRSVSFGRPADSIGLIIAALIIMISFALISGILLLALVEMYIVINAGIVLLGFGALRWTREFSQKYLIYAVSVGIKLFVMQLLIGLGETLIQGWVADFNAGNNTQVFVLVGASIVMLSLVKEIPAILSGLINGLSFSTGDSLMGPIASAGGAAVGAIAGGVGATMAVREASKLAQASGASGPMGMMKGTLSNLASGLKDDLSNRVTGNTTSNIGTMGGRMAERFKEQQLGNTIRSGGK